MIDAHSPDDLTMNRIMQQCDSVAVIVITFSGGLIHIAHNGRNKSSEDAVKQFAHEVRVSTSPENMTIPAALIG